MHPQHLLIHHRLHEPNIQWLREVAFGGDARLELLLQAFEQLQQRWMAELFIVSFADKDVITRVLELIGALRYFGAEGKHVYGWREVGGPTAGKGELLARLAHEKGWGPRDVLFLDDQVDNLRSVGSVSRSFWVRGKGLSIENIENIENYRKYRTYMKLCHFLYFRFSIF